MMPILSSADSAAWSRPRTAKPKQRVIFVILLCLAAFAEGQGVTSKKLRIALAESDKAAVETSFNASRWLEASCPSHCKPLATSFIEQKPEDDFNEETHLFPESSIGVTWESIIAFCFVAVIASVPLILQFAQPEHRSRMTWTSIGESIFLIIWLVGTIVLFTTLIKFTSVHFETLRPLTIVECVYLMAQIITTVGYGDIVPAFPRGQVTVGACILVSILLIANMVSQVTDLIMQRVQAFADDLADEVQHSHSDAADDLMEAAASSFRPQVPYLHLLASCVTFLLFVLAGVLFYVLYPGEGKTLLQAVYMSVITLSTVGFGAVTPATEGGKVFGAFWMLFGVAALVSTIGAFTEFMAKLKEKERHDNKKDIDKFVTILRKERTAANDRLSEHGFLRLFLIYQDLVTEDTLEWLEKQFDELQPDKDDKVDCSMLGNLTEPPAGEIED